MREKIEWKDGIVSCLGWNGSQICPMEPMGAVFFVLKYNCRGEWGQIPMWLHGARTLQSTEECMLVKACSCKGGGFTMIRTKHTKVHLVHGSSGPWIIAAVPLVGKFDPLWSMANTFWCLFYVRTFIDLIRGSDFDPLEANWRAEYFECKQIRVCLCSKAEMTAINSLVKHDRCNKFGTSFHASQISIFVWMW